MDRAVKRLFIALKCRFDRQGFGGGEDFLLLGALGGLELHLIAGLAQAFSIGVQNQFSGTGEIALHLFLTDEGVQRQPTFLRQFQ
ncbi:hypothetical protein D3C76_1184650 [compost metagenome]